MKRLLPTILLATLLASSRVFALEIADVEEALTLAQIERAGKTHTILVLADDGSSVTAIDISKRIGAFPDDSLELVRSLGYDAIAGFATDALPRLSLPHRSLRPTSAGSIHNIAAGINYPEHGEETAITSDPFLFPKTVAGTGSRSAVPARTNQLLDYEIELCARFDRDIRDANDIAGATIGLFLCGDFTDRATLMRLMDTSSPESGIGFTDAKSFPGFMPTGPYLVVPRDRSTFLRKIRLQLSTNGDTRQDGYASEMTWPIEKLIAEALRIGLEPRWQTGGDAIALLPGRIFAKGMVLQTGTPEGVIFRPPSTGYKFRRGLQYFLTAGFLRGGPTQYVIECYIADLLQAGQFLQAGDRVRMQGTFLGSIETLVTRSED